MNTLTIRKAKKEDCPRLLELIKDLAIYEKAPEEITVTLEHFENSGFGDNPMWWDFVAKINEWICGFALYYIRFRTWKGQRMHCSEFSPM